MSGSFHFSFFVQSDKRAKILSVICRHNADFHSENKQTGQLIFFVFGHFDRKTKNGMNQTKLDLNKNAIELGPFARTCNPSKWEADI